MSRISNGSLGTLNSRRGKRFTVREHPACLGGHTETILAELGYTAGEIGALKAEGTVLRSNRMLHTDRARGQ